MSSALNDQIMKTFAKKLKAARKAGGYRSAEQFAHALGVVPHTYRHYERGFAQPNLTTLTRICQLLEIGPNDLLPLAASYGRGGGGKKGGAASGPLAA